ncbi:MAG: WHG domain-containing protein [Deinococcota bacterium]
MPKRPGLTKEKLVDAAINIINQNGVSSLSIASLAAKLNVKPPSLYNHMNSLKDLQRAIVLRGLKKFTQIGQEAAMGRAGYDALKAVATSYREFAKHQPGFYEITLQSNEGQDAELVVAEKEALEIFIGILRGYNLEEEHALHAIRAIRSSIHGFVALEVKGGFGLPLDIEESFHYHLQILDYGIKKIWGDNARLTP